MASRASARHVSLRKTPVLAFRASAGGTPLDIFQPRRFRIQVQRTTRPLQCKSQVKLIHP